MQKKWVWGFSRMSLPRLIPSVWTFSLCCSWYTSRLCVSSHRYRYFFREWATWWDGWHRQKGQNWMQIHWFLIIIDCFYRNISLKIIQCAQAGFWFFWDRGTLWRCCLKVDMQFFRIWLVSWFGFIVWWRWLSLRRDSFVINNKK